MATMQQLQQVVLHHVAQRAGAIVELTATFDADRLGER